MRILVIADIHANWPALQAVASEPHDLCVCLGDLVEYALQPVPVLDWARRHVAISVRGNHDHGAAQNVTTNGKAGFRYLTTVTRAVTRAMLGPDDLRYLGALPLSRMVTLDNRRYLFVHASPRDPLDEYSPPDPEFWARRLEGLDVDVVCVGHTHHPYQLSVDGMTVLNPGSVGQPRDGDPRAAYAVIEGDTIELKRVEYPIEETLAAIRGSTLAPRDKDMLCEVFRRGGSALNNGHRAGG